LKSIPLEGKVKQEVVIAMNNSLPSKLSENLQPKTRPFPQLIKYMGSKAKIIDFISDAISSVHTDGHLCDLFSGSCSLSGALGAKYNIHTNDIQRYSEHLGSFYLKPISEISGEDIVRSAKTAFHRSYMSLPKSVMYGKSSTLAEFNKVESANRNLIRREFAHKYHLFLKYYSGTWWSAEQCAWIDALKQVIDRKKKSGQLNDSDYSFCLCILMHAMAYSSQGTGHFAQYRDAKTNESMKDINIYRQKNIPEIFLKKFEQLKTWSHEHVHDLGHKITHLDYSDCLSTFCGGTVYADPPYAFVHYSRFYHAFETLALYDYPELQVKNGRLVKGRYRTDRHQSPFSIRSKAEHAFAKLFSGVRFSRSNLVLSYSNSALISRDILHRIAKLELGTNYEIWLEDKEHQHMTMGRSDEPMKDVKELVVIAKYIGA